MGHGAPTCSGRKCRRNWFEKAAGSVSIPISSTVGKARHGNGATSPRPHPTSRTRMPGRNCWAMSSWKACQSFGRRPMTRSRNAFTRDDKFGIALFLGGGGLRSTLHASVFSPHSASHADIRNRAAGMSRRARALMGAALLRVAAQRDVTNWPPHFPLLATRCSSGLPASANDSRSSVFWALHAAARCAPTSCPHLAFGPNGGLL